MAASLTTDPCADCGFDPAQWNEQDTAKTLGLAPEFVQEWSARTENPMTSPFSRAAATALLEGGADDQRLAVHQLWHGLVTELAPVQPVFEGSGVVTQLNVSSGGVPKTAIDRGEVGIRGLMADTQNARVHHGRPWQALCLWSTDVLAELQAEGHPIGAGSAGENVTLSGIDWASLRGGMRLTIGAGDDAVECQLTLPAVPCSKNSAWFLNGDIDRMDHDLNPGSSRWYASVLRPGWIATGDAVRFG